MNNEEEAILAEAEYEEEEAAVMIMRVGAFARRRKRSRHHDMRSVREWAVALGSMPQSEDEESEDDGRRGPRTVHPRPPYEDSSWARMLRNPALADPASRDAQLFRRRFRVPYQFFLQLVDLVEERRWFSTTAVDVCGRQCIPVNLKVLAALQVLGRGTCFDDVSQTSLMSEPVACMTFHTFCRHFAAELYHAHVRLPTGDEQVKVMEDFHKLGFTGAVGSTDVIHVRWDACSDNLLRTNTGKEGHPTIAYAATVDHSGRVLAMTAGLPGSYNDKTIICADAVVIKIKEDPLCTERVFHLMGADGSAVECKGNYLLVDNCYHKWRVLIPPTKCPYSEEDVRLSKWLESVRKDAECFFGRLKGRFRFLKLSILLREKERVDNAMFTACMLHNMLHTMDGLDNLDTGVSWSGVDGQHDSGAVAPDLDVSTVGRQCVGEEEVQVKNAHFEFREKLMTSFSYRWKLNDIQWLVSPDPNATAQA